jgi:8-oxo-dGTP pyrophosphatase MutT (NUDIX family)
MKHQRVYVNDLPVDFIAPANLDSIPVGEGVEIVSESSLSVNELLDRLTSGVYRNGVVVLCSDVISVWHRWTALFTLSVAAGGVVHEPGGNILVIFRRGKWDLPKGKLDADETPEQAAIREVEEECGIHGLSLGRLVQVTFHTYTEKKKSILKKTFWYSMDYDGRELPVPQEEEDIEAVEWMSPEEVRSKVFANTYRSVREVLDRAL